MSSSKRSINKQAQIPSSSVRLNPVSLVSQQTITASPYPTPEQAREYEKICPGFLKDILDMSKAEQTHMQELNKETMALNRDTMVLNKETMAINKTIVQSEASCRKLGLIFAFIVAMVALMGGFFLILKGFVGIGVTFAAGTLATIVGSFIYGSRGMRAKSEEQ